MRFATQRAFTGTGCSGESGTCSLIMTDEQGVSMVLEETLVVYDPDEARRIAGELRKKGIPVRIVRKDILVRSIDVIGRIRDLKAAIEEGIAQIGEDDDARPRLKRTLASLGEDEEEIATFLQQHPPGKAVTPVMPKKNLLELYQAFRTEGAGEEEVSGEIAKILKSRRIFALLERNGLIEWTKDEEAILHGHADPADLVTALSGEIIEEIGLETLKRHAVKTSMTIISEPDYRLEFNPEAISMIQIADLDELVNEMEIDLDAYDLFRDSVYAKRTVASRVIGIFEGRGTVPAEEIFAVLQSDVFEIPGKIEEITLDLDLDFVKGLLDDMRRIGMIRRKGAGYRLA